MDHHAVDHGVSGDSLIHRLDARAKLLAVVVLIITAVSTPPISWRPFAAYAGGAVLLLAAAHVPPRYVLRRVMVIVPFALVMTGLVPFLHQGPPSDVISVWGLSLSRSGLIVAANAAVKAVLGVLCIALLTATTSLPGVLEGLGRLRVPGVLVALTGFTYRYLHVFAEEVVRMKRARDSRGYRGRNLRDARLIGSMVGSLFLRSYERAERVHQAMLARGYDGTHPHYAAKRLRLADYAFMAAVGLAAAAVRVALP